MDNMTISADPEGKRKSFRVGKAVLHITETYEADAKRATFTIDGRNVTMGGEDAKLVAQHLIDTFGRPWGIIGRCDDPKTIWHQRLEELVDSVGDIASVETEELPMTDGEEAVVNAVLDGAKATLDAHFDAMTDRRS